MDKDDNNKGMADFRREYFVEVVRANWLQLVAVGT